MKPAPLPFLLVIETLADLVIASLRLRLAPFDRLVAHLPTQNGPPIDTEEARLLRRAIRGWARRLPWRAECFEQGVAAARFLARHGHPATLHYGARGAGDDLEAHVWVGSGDVRVIGWENSSEFRELQRFPPR